MAGSAISGILIIRNGVKLGYPFKAAFQSLRELCDEVIVSVDPHSEDNTLRIVMDELTPDCVVLSPWDMDNHRGDGDDEVSRQTDRALQYATRPWVFSLQADEVLHEAEIPLIKRAIKESGASCTGFWTKRLYFFRDLQTIRTDWTADLLRLFRRGTHRPDYMSGAMQFIRTEGEDCPLPGVNIYHYSRVGDPVLISRRIRNLDSFYHEPSLLTKEEELPDYDFSTVDLDGYRQGHEPKAVEGVLAPFKGTHPKFIDTKTLGA